MLIKQGSSPSAYGKSAREYKRKSVGLEVVGGNLEVGLSYYSNIFAEQLLNETTLKYRLLFVCLFLLLLLFLFIMLHSGTTDLFLTR